MRDFFSEFERARVRHGEGELDRAAIRPASLNPAYLCIGRDADLTELVVKEGSETVFEIDGSESSEAGMRAYPSVYHWVLSTCDALYPD